MARNVRIEEMASAIMESMEEYADLATEDLKKAVKSAGEAVRDEIRNTAPKRTGVYRKSWAVKNTKETANALEVTVYSRDRYRLTHLLEFGHAKRGGGRVAGRPHIAPAQKTGMERLEAEIERSLKNG